MLRSNTRDFHDVPAHRKQRHAAYRNTNMNKNVTDSWKSEKLNACADSINQALFSAPSKEPGYEAIHLLLSFAAHAEKSMYET